MNIHPRSSWSDRTPLGELHWDYGKRYVVVHWTAGPSAADQEQWGTPALLVGMEHFHMDRKGGWAIFYNFVVDQEGEVWEGRGWNMRGGAQGVTESDRQDISIAAILAPGEVPSAAMLNALEAFHAVASDRGWDQGKKGHMDFKPKACPGPDLYAWTKQEPVMPEPMPEWARPTFEKAVAAGVFSQYTDPAGTVEAWELAIFLERLGLLDPEAPHDHVDLATAVDLADTKATRAENLATLAQKGSAQAQARADSAHTRLNKLREV